MSGFGKPRLKRPDVKAPAFLGDLYHDLRDRRLLPLMALVLVAIAAVPLLLGDSSEEFEASAGGGVIAGLESAKDRSASLAVVEATPGLREYRKRLSGRTPTDPFKQHFSSGSLKGAQLNEKKGGSGEGTKGETTSTSTTDGSAAGGSKGAGAGGGGGSADGGSSPAPGGSPPSTEPSAPPKGSGNSGERGLTFYAYAIDVRIVKSVDGKAEQPVVRERVLPQTGLPGDKQPVVTYMGPARKGKKATGKALLLVSEQVTEIAGDVNCVSGEEVCQLLEVEPGFPVVLSYGEDGVRYTLNVLELGLVVTGHS